MHRTDWTGRGAEGKTERKKNRECGRGEKERASEVRANKTD